MTSRIPSRLSRRAAAGAALAAGTVVLAAGPAWAHVTVQPSTAAKGSYSTVAFQVPNEKDDASTTKLEVFFPTDHPVPSVSVQPVPGWTAKVHKSKLAKPVKTHDGTVTEAVSKITWTGGAVKPNEFQQFKVSLGPLPDDTGKLVFKALQTYSDKDVVRWIEPARPGGDEPEHPAPALTLTKAGADAPDGAASSGSASSGSGSSASGSSDRAQAAGGSADSTARTLGIVGIVVGAAGAAAGVLGWRRGRRPAAGSSGTAGSAGS